MVGDAILTSTPDRSALIIDIPSSLESPPNHILRSDPPPQTPFTLPEPKTSTPLNPSFESHHTTLSPTITTSLTILSHLHRGPYCNPRHPFLPTTPELDFHANTSYLSLPSPPEIFPAPSELSDLSDLYGHVLTNPAPTWQTLTILYPAPAKRFFLPPNSSFLLSPVIPAALPQSLKLYNFDFLLLDPPWPNRSAQRKGDYGTSNRFEIIPLLKSIPVAQMTRSGALIAVWVTNKMKLRQQLITLVASAWGCEPVVEAEWVWLKVTESGQPVVDLESKVKKPYESLLFFRRKEIVKGRRKRVEGKVIVGVPDKHSRKPGLRGLVEGYLPERYRGAEVFGRGLTEGWFTWGDEAVRWNWERWWEEEKEGGHGGNQDTEMGDEEQDVEEA